MKLRAWLCLVALLGLASLATASAQERTDIDEVRSRLRKGLHQAIEQGMIRFWEPRLNAYKVRIDGIFSRRDLEQLDELRASYAIVTARLREFEERDRHAHETNAASRDVMVDSVMAPAAAPAAEKRSAAATPPGEDFVAAGTADTTSTVSTVAAEESADDIERDRIQMERQWRRERAERADRDADESEARLAAGGDDDSYSAVLAGHAEMRRLPTIASWLARTYRSQLDLLGDDLLADLGRCGDSLRAIIAGYHVAHSTEFARVSGDMETDADLTAPEELDRMVRHPRTFRKIYRTEMEPQILLYNGDGLAQMVNAVAPATEDRDNPAKPSMIVTASPNPATTMANLTFTLPDASSSTSVRIVDGHGETMLERTLDGSGAGAHDVSLDLAGFANGWYVCQVNAQLPHGTHVASCVIRVMR